MKNYDLLQNIVYLFFVAAGISILMGVLKITNGDIVFGLSMIGGGVVTITFGLLIELAINVATDIQAIRNRTNR